MAVVGVDTRLFLGLMRLLIDVEGRFELFALGRGVDIVAHEPHITNLVFLALPALNKVSGPQNNEDGIDSIDWRIEGLEPVDALFS